MVNFLTRSNFLEIMQEEIDKMVEEEGLILREKFPQVMRQRLSTEIRRSLARQAGLVDHSPV